MQAPTWLLSSWAEVGRTALIGVLAYAALVVLLRVSGKRTLSKMNAFDLVVTVALGSTLASTLTSKSVALINGIAAFTILIALQFIVAWTSSRSPRVNRMVKSEPALLVYRGRVLVDALHRERVSLDEVLAALRKHGTPTFEDVEAVVLETDGTFSLVPRTEDASAVLGGLRGSSQLEELRRTRT